MDARTLYHQAVLAIRDHHDLVRGRALLVQSLKLDPRNDKAWLWLARTVENPEKQLECVERALRINPDNETAQELKKRLLANRSRVSPAADATTESAEEARSPAIHPIGPLTVDVPVSSEENTRIAQLMDKAEIYLEAGETEEAIAQWVEVLSIRVDHELALRNAAGHLWKLRYWDDAKELVQRAITAGTRVPAIYLTAIDMAERQGDAAWAHDLRAQIATRPDVDEQLVVKVADYYLNRHDGDIARQFLLQALETHPDAQAVLIKLGDVLKEAGQLHEATQYYDRAVRLDTRTRAGKEADERLSQAAPILTDRERGSVLLALRETLGVAALFLFMGWQDAGLDLFDMGPRRWGGVFLSLLGGYLLVTATSSPQQRPIAAWLGGAIPPQEPQPQPSPAGAEAMMSLRAPGRVLEEPTNLPVLPKSARYLLAITGIILLVLAFVLVFYHSLDWVSHHRPPYLPW